MAIFTILIASQYTINALELLPQPRELIRFAVITLCTIVLVKLVSGQPERPAIRQADLSGKSLPVRPGNDQTKTER
ncbi:MAG: hypothetical protein ABSE73_02050 [Planctomycetota bacterium]